MVKPLPKWEMSKYSMLWKKFRNKSFTNQEAHDLLREKDGHLISVLFYDLKRYGWVEISRDKSDKRKKNYKLKEPNLAVVEMAG